MFNIVPHVVVFLDWRLNIYSASYLYCGIVGFNTMCNPLITIKNLIPCYSLQSEELCKCDMIL